MFYSVHFHLIVFIFISNRTLWLSIPSWITLGIGRAISIVPFYSDMHRIAKWVLSIPLLLSHYPLVSVPLLLSHYPLVSVPLLPSHYPLVSVPLLLSHYLLVSVPLLLSHYPLVSIPLLLSHYPLVSVPFCSILGFRNVVHFSVIQLCCVGNRLYIRFFSPCGCGLTLVCWVTADTVMCKTALPPPNPKGEKPWQMCPVFDHL